jgi:transcriptional antiterminator RfaH
MPYAVVMTKPNHEAIAATNLQRQGFDFYYPKFLQKNSKNPILKPQIKPLFPRYIFVFIGQAWRPLNGTRGISYVLMGEEGPQLIPDKIIELIKSREDKSGLFQLTQPPKFTLGAKVKTQEGPLAGLSLIYEGMAGPDRAKILVELLGRAVRATLEEKLLTAA